MEFSVRQVKAVDLTCSEAEVSDQKMVAEPTEAGRCYRHPPWRREMVTRNQLLYEVSVLVENSDCSRASRRIDLVRAPSRRVGDENITTDISNVEWSEPGGQFGIREGARCK